VNVIKAWRGAVEPAELGPSGNEIKTWRGAIEPVGVGATSRSIYGVSFDVTRNVTRGVTESWSNR